MSDLESTIFLYDKRISTTIFHNGKRAIGTKVEDKKVKQIVLHDKNIFNDNTRILGVDFSTIYWPLQDNSGNVFGMFFIGKNEKAVKKTVITITWACLISTVIIAFFLSFLGVYFFRSVVSPIEQKSVTDFLTGIYNRAGFEEYLVNSLSTDSTGALFLIDIDHFKILNDTLGHATGDKCLQDVGKILRNEFRKTDIVARLGGDEFIIYVPGMHELNQISEKAKKIVRNIYIEYNDSKNKVCITASIGISRFPDDGKSYEELYKSADKSLYHVKRSGRNNYMICNGENIS